MKLATRGAMEAPIELKGDNDPANDDAAGIVTKALDDLSKSVETRLSEVETKATARLDELEKRLNRPAQEPANDNANAAETKGFNVYIRTGNKAAEEVKALRVSNDPSGGYLAPPDWTTEFIRDLVEYSPIRSIASTRKTSLGSVVMGKRTGITNAKWKGENEAQEASEPAFGQHEVTIREVNTYVDISNQLLQDAAADVEAEVRLALAEDFGQKEATAFVNGSGTLEPRGFMVHPDVAYAANTHATDLKADALIAMLYSLPAEYRNKGVWTMNGTTLGKLRTLKDGQSNYLWQPAYAAGQPETILGRPVVECVDMDDVAANKFPIAFGDFNTAYRIIDRTELSILVNPFLLATQGMTRFHATRRVGADVVQPKAIKKLKMATS
ncbi:MAG: phage major capsid protein [Beijerinckiaceae bacterium]